jgi:hypothetical protein
MADGSLGYSKSALPHPERKPAIHQQFGHFEQFKLNTSTYRISGMDSRKINDHRFNLRCAQPWREEEVGLYGNAT